MTKLNRFPSITDAEFEDACCTLEQRCHDNLNGTDWLSVKWHGSWLEVKQASEIRRDDGRAHGAEKDADVGDETLDEKLINTDDEDVDAIARHAPDGHDRPAIDFSIHLSPTYRCPVLWFSLSSTRSAKMDDLNEIYSHVIPLPFRSKLRGIGLLGGISLAHHPATDRPTFFIHPCDTQAAMKELNNGSDLDPFQYLQLWFGIAAASIGLHIPSKVASSA